MIHCSTFCAREYSNTRCLRRIRHCWVVVVSCGTIVRSSTGSPTVFRHMYSSAKVRVDVCKARVGRACRTVSFLVVGFAFTLPLIFLERVDLHRVIICACYTSRIRPKVSGFLTPLQQSCSKSGAVGIRTQLQSVPEKIGATVHLDCICQRSSKKCVTIPRHPAPRLSNLVQNLPRDHTSVSRAT